MFRKILVATDLSEASDLLINCIGMLKAVGTKEAWLVHVLDVCEVGGLSEYLERLHIPDIERQADVLKKHKLNVHKEIVLGVPFVEINRLADQKRVSVIVVGSHGRGLVKELLLGSTAFEVVRQSTHPVLVLRHEIIEHEGRKKCRINCRNPFQHILYATDFSKNAQHALTYVSHICKGAHSRVTLVHVQESSRIDPHLKDRLTEFNRIDAERLNSVSKMLKHHGAGKIDVAIPYGHPVEEILKVEKKSKPSLIVLGSQGRSWSEELFLGGVAHNVLRHAKAPALIVPWKKQ